MELNKDRIIELTLKYLRNELDEVERVELNNWLSEPYNLERFNERIKVENILEGIVLLDTARVDTDVEFNLDSSGVVIKPVSTSKLTAVGKRRRFWMAAAAAAVVFGIVGAVWYSGQKEPKKGVLVPAVASALTPTRNKAILTLSDGSEIKLDDAQKGKVAKQGNVDIVKEDDGRLAYRNGEGAGAVGYNTIETPRGVEYQVVLSDGTRVWLDAGSSLRFPAMFSGGTREVTLTGQGYFETKQDPKHPFIVSVGKMRVEVLGTSFNIMAFEEEQEAKATLITGAVKVIEEKDSVLLHPEQEAEIQKAGAMTIRKVNIDQVLAWKNGFLEFDGADITSVMHAVSRWWDFDVRFEAGSDRHSFTGQLNKSLTATEVLKILTTSGYHFEVKGRVVTVLP